jgi:lipooligosaccharide transport system ATP-binding protein
MCTAYPTPSTKHVLEARGLAKSYDGQRVVNGLDLDLRAGTILGLLGSNGAGKTTTLKMLYGFIEPEAGSIRYNGRDFKEHRTRIKREIGVCTQDDTLDTDFSVEENLRVYASYFRPRVENLDSRVDELLDTFDLRQFSTMPPIQLSGGFRRRLLIARSVIHRPQILFLDEPTTGLDPKARIDLWELIDGMRTDGMAIILTTHYMDEAERLSDDMIVLDKGRNVAQGKPDTVLGELIGEHIAIIPAGDDAQRRATLWARQRGNATPASVLGELHLPLRGGQLGEFSAEFSDVRFEVRRPNLDDLFLSMALETNGEVEK